ncbi:MAG: YeeE/YedE family protein [Planctomycetes bacterium]|nr:YeeE/YedE family protein [Planctomycetota bacterium]
MPRPYWNPYVAGAGLGLVLLFSYLVLGTGLGASGAITRAAVVAAHGLAPAAVEQNPWLGSYYADGQNPLAYYLVAMFVGTLLGGLLSSFAAGRIAPGVERGPTAGIGLRLCLALVGGALAGIGARFASGCTSGMALSGGALLQTGSFVFTGACFAAAFALAPMVRKEWR